jgi:hypothetical protein
MRRTHIKAEEFAKSDFAASVKIVRLGPVGF